MKCKTSWFLIAAAVVATLVRCFADTASTSSLPESEVAEINKFLRDFTNALNSNDADRIKQMSGSAWAHFSGKMDRDEKIDGFEIVKLSIDKVTNVVTKAIVIDKRGSPYKVEVVFDLKNVNGVYSVDKMRLPESERLHEEFEAADRTFDKLMVAIKNKDIGKVKEALPFGDVADFDAELLARGLSWIKDAVNSDAITLGVWGVGRSGNEDFVGHVEISFEPGGTNVLHEVIFKGLKIDRAAPRRETYEEFCERIKAEQKADRKQYEAKRAAEYKRQNAEARERLKKELKDIGALK